MGSSAEEAAKAWLDSFCAAAASEADPEKLQDLMNTAAEDAVVEEGGSTAASTPVDVFDDEDVVPRATRRRKLGPPPGAARARAEGLLSTHRLGKSGRHFVCAASLGPRGGPDAERERQLERERRRKKAEQSWAAVDLRRHRRTTGETPGPGAHDVHYAPVAKRTAVATLGPPRAKVAGRPRRRPAPETPVVVGGGEEEAVACQECYATCWWGCECDCHLYDEEEDRRGGDGGMDDSEARSSTPGLSSSSSSSRGEGAALPRQSTVILMSPKRHRHGATTMSALAPAPKKAPRLAPPAWFCALVNRGVDVADDVVAFGDVDRALRAAVRSSEAPDADDARVVARLLKFADNDNNYNNHHHHHVAAPPSSGAMKFPSQEKPLDALFVDLTRDELQGTLVRKAGWSEDDFQRLARLCQVDADPLFPSARALTRALDATVLKPQAVAAKLKRVIDSRKLRVADVYRSAADAEGRVLATALAREIGKLVFGGVLLEYAKREVVLDDDATDGQRHEEGSCCVATCWWGCTCACHGELGATPVSDDEDEDGFAPPSVGIILSLGDRVEVRGAGMEDAYFPGAVACAYEDGSFDVEYDDGAFEGRVDPRRRRGYRFPDGDDDDDDAGAARKELADPQGATWRPRRQVKRPFVADLAKPLDAATVARGDRGVLAWQKPPEPKKAATEEAPGTDPLLRASAVERAEAAIARRRDRGVYAWATTDRGLLGATTTTAKNAPPEEEAHRNAGHDTPVSLKGAVRAHVPGFAFDPPVYGEDSEDDHSDDDGDGDLFMGDVGDMSPLGDDSLRRRRRTNNKGGDALGPGAYEPQWAATRPRAPGAVIVKAKKTELRPLSQLAMARRAGVASAPGEYDVDAGLARSRYARTTTAALAPPTETHEARRRPADVKAELDEVARRERRKRREAKRRDRALRAEEKAVDAKFKAWRAQKLGTESSSSSSYEDSEESRRSDDGSSSDDEDGLGTPASLTRATRRRTVAAKIAAAPQAPTAGVLLERRIEADALARKRGPDAYDVRKSLAFLEKPVVSAATFGAEVAARERHEGDARMSTVAAYKKAADFAAERARDVLLGPQLQHGWTSPPRDGEGAAHARFVRSSKAVFKYVERAETPDRVRTKRLLEAAAAEARDMPVLDEEKRRELLDDEQHPRILLDKDRGRDKTEVLKKGLGRLSHFGSPARKSLKAPLSADYDAEEARRALRPEDRAAAAAFASAARDELAGPFGERPAAYAREDGEGDTLFLDPRAPVDESRQGFTFAQAHDVADDDDENDNVDAKNREGDHLDIDLAPRFSLAHQTARGHRYLRMSKGDDRFPAVDEEAVRGGGDSDGEELWLSPSRSRRFLDKSDAAPVFNRSLRFSVQEEDNTERPPELILSPTVAAVKRRTAMGVVPMARQSDRWDRDDEVLRNHNDDAQELWLSTTGEGGQLDAQQTRGLDRGKGFKSVDFSRAPARFASESESSPPQKRGEGDVLLLSPRRAKSQTQPVEWSRVSERWGADDSDLLPDRPREGDVLLLDPRGPAPPPVPAPHLPASPKRAASPPRSRDGDRLVLNPSQASAKRLLQAVDMTRALDRGDNDPTDDRQRGLVLDQALFLSPKDAVPRPRLDKSVKFAALPRPSSPTTAKYGPAQPRKVRRSKLRQQQQQQQQQREKAPPEPALQLKDPYSNLIDKMEQVNIRGHA